MKLITRSDFDGLACGTLLLYLGMINEWQFVHPKDIQDGLIQATDNDILANIPYIPGCKLWFDHHSSEAERLGKKAYFEGVSRRAPSCARVIYEYYGGDEKLGRFAEMIRYADKVDSGDLNLEEIKHPSGWVLLGFITDPRTGLGQFNGFSTSNNDFMINLATACSQKNIEEIMAIPDLIERKKVYFEEEELFLSMLQKHVKVDGNVIVADFRELETIHAGNRFLIYTLFPEQNISITLISDGNKKNTIITVGYSIINRSATLDVGSMLLSYGGGGHNQVGTCQLPNDEADKAIAEIISKCKGS